MHRIKFTLLLISQVRCNLYRNYFHLEEEVDDFSSSYLCLTHFNSVFYIHTIHPSKN